MTFQSYSFILLFLPLTLLIYHLSDVRVRKWVLILSSVVFYGFFGIYSAAVLFAGCVINYGFYLKVTSGKAGRSWLILGVALNVALLVFFKLSGGLQWDTRFGILMPMAFSFTTFTQIAFLCDAYSAQRSGSLCTKTLHSRTIPCADVSFLDYLIHILFFPKLLQGPIQRFEQTKEGILDRLEARITSEDLLQGLTLFTFGLAKKVLLADTLGKAVAFGYEATLDLTRPDAILTVLLYPMQLDLDFSGYCDMGRGIARMMGFDLVQNFNLPLRATSVTEFWSRWHMSLTQFFTRYVYIPLGGNRKGMARTCCNIMIVFILSGLWHGTGWGFLIWGVLHGAAMCIEKVLRIQKKPHAGMIASALRRVITYLFVSVAFVFFRAPSVTRALELLMQPGRVVVNFVSPAMAKCFSLDEIWYPIKALHLDGWRFGEYICMAVMIAISVVVSMTKMTRKPDKGTGAMSRFCILTGMLLAWCVLSLGEVQTFMYVNF